jgi:hypothetical protein
VVRSGTPSDARRKRRDRNLELVRRRIEYLDKRRHEPDAAPHRAQWDKREQFALMWAYGIIRQAQHEGLLIDLEARAYRSDWLHRDQEER